MYRLMLINTECLTMSHGADSRSLCSVSVRVAGLKGAIMLNYTDSGNNAEYESSLDYDYYVEEFILDDYMDALHEMLSDDVYDLLNNKRMYMVSSERAIPLTFTKIWEE